jgi:hypothetical protein
MNNEPKDHPNEIFLPIVNVINGTFLILLNLFVVTHLSLECMSRRFHPARDSIQPIICPMVVPPPPLCATGPRVVARREIVPKFRKS